MLNNTLHPRAESSHRGKEEHASIDNVDMTQKLKALSCCTDLWFIKLSLKTTMKTAFSA